MQTSPKTEKQKRVMMLRDRAIAMVLAGGCRSGNFIYRGQLTVATEFQERRHKAKY